MRILLLTHAFNSLTQRLFVELRARGHEVAVEIDVNDDHTEQAVELFRPALILAPFLKCAIPESVWRKHLCLVVHPGPPGDRGPSALDWAVLAGEREWGVTVLQANAEMDAGPVWASESFPMREAAKSSLYRHEVTEAALRAVLRAIDRAEDGGFEPEVPAESLVHERPSMPQSARAIDWQADTTADVLRKVRSADGVPGVLDAIDGRALYLYDAHSAPGLSGKPGEFLARSGPAVCRATRDGAVWIGHLRERSGPNPFKLPAVDVLGPAAAGLPEVPPNAAGAYREVWYEEEGPVGYLHFPFYNGAMGVRQCELLLSELRAALARPTRVLVLMGGPDFWCNGMHLNLIEAAESPADESWRNINAIDDVAEALILAGDKLTVSALRGNAGAGGVFLARAADEVWVREGVVLNPHYKDMGNLYGSEYWSYQLPRRAGPERAERVMQARLPVGAEEAPSLGLVDVVLMSDDAAFMEEVRERATALAAAPDYAKRIADKQARRAADEAEKPLAQYRAEELERMRLNFYGFDPSYHVARYNFVHKVPKSRTPVTIGPHRSVRRRSEV